jgi:hypothetical protein
MEIEGVIKEVDINSLFFLKVSERAKAVDREEETN